jgi:hypothetical protein
MAYLLQLFGILSLVFAPLLVSLLLLTFPLLPASLLLLASLMFQRIRNQREIQIFLMSFLIL